MARGEQGLPLKERAEVSSINITQTHTHILDPLLNHTGLELKCEPKAGLALFIVKCGCIKHTLNTAGTFGTAEKPQLGRPLIKPCSRPCIHPACISVLV